jgi:hypothetical protein
VHRRSALLLVVTLATVVDLPGRAEAADPGVEFFSSQPKPTWGTSDSTVERQKAGRVLALAEAGDRVFLAGEFAGLVPPGTPVGGRRDPRDRVPPLPPPAVARPYLVALDVNTGALIDWDAYADGPVQALAVSPDGRRLYVGGRFDHIGGAPAANLAALDLASGQLDPAFAPPPVDAAVRALEIRNGTLYVGGAFTHTGDTPRPGLAAFDANTGALRVDWVPPSRSGGSYQGHTGSVRKGGDPGRVIDMKVSGDGSVLIVGGTFLRFGGQAGLLTLDAATGRPTPWQPSMDRPVNGVAVWPGDASTFFVSTGGTGGQVQAFRFGDGRKPRWAGKVDGDATDVAATNERVYLVGHYDYVLGGKTACGRPPCKGSDKKGDTPNRHLSAFDARTGAHDLSFTAQANTPQGPYVALIGARNLYVGGDFTEINGRPQPGFVQFPAQ